MTEAAAPVGITVLIPAYNEAESLRELIPAVDAVLRPATARYEILVVDDGSTDGTSDVATELRAQYPQVGVLTLRRNFGKSAALNTGFHQARGAYVITMDADLQDDPNEIPGLIAALESGGYDLVSGWKRKRHDPITKTLPSRLFNRVTSWMTGIRLHDFNCGLKAYRREVVESIELYGEMHRYIPVLAHGEGFRIGEREVQHHPRRYGQSKFGSARFVNGFLDLLEVMFLAGGRRTPLHVFGRWGVGLLTLGGGINLYMLVVWVAEGKLRVRPLLLFGVILVILGIQFISMGLLAELIFAPAMQKRNYPLKAQLRPEGAPESVRGKEGE
ncbi:MAG: glycosyltransferase family 2 protein [Candidatus Eisenbacteria bacterium]|nr:glycosyltransferase family 2 protein [Candidatus Eisenbacteria bacterium]MCC7142454.1 glycosyltransferase family 2 protein [Candidatus Eisenbacteria bacterium]